MRWPDKEQVKPHCFSRYLLREEAKPKVVAWGNPRLEFTYSSVILLLLYSDVLGVVGATNNEQT